MHASQHEVNGTTARDHGEATREAPGDLPLWDTGVLRAWFAGGENGRVKWERGSRSPSRGGLVAVPVGTKVKRDPS